MTSGDIHFEIVCHATREDSLAITSRRLARLIETGYPNRVRLRPIDAPDAADLSRVSLFERDFIRDLLGRPPIAGGARIVIVLCYPMFVPPGLQRNAGDRLVAWLFWEEFPLPPDLVAMLNEHYDAVVSNTRFVTKIFVDSGVRIPIHTVGFAPDLADFADLRRPERPRADGVFTFLHVSTCVPRKGVDVLVAAYARAFRRGDPVRLLIKSAPNHYNQAHRLVREVQARDAHAPDIVVIDRNMDRAELRDIMAASDAMVLPTRGEGLNLPAAEAMMAGLPLIVTGFSGHMDFCSEATARLVDFSFSLSRSHLRGEQPAVWVDPDEADLAAALHEAVAAPDAALGRRAALAKARVTAQMHPALFIAHFRAASQSVAVQSIVGQSLPPAACRIAWVSSWGVRCGIAEHSAQMLAHFPQSGPARVSVLSDSRTAPTRQAGACQAGAFHAGADHAELPVFPVWAVHGAGTDAGIAGRAVAQAADVIVIQHHPSLIAWHDLAALLRHPDIAARVVVVALHNSADLLTRPDELVADLVGRLGAVARVVVHTLAELNRLKRLGLVENVTMLPLGMHETHTASRPASVPRPFQRNTVWLVGCYGFHYFNKGIAELIHAVGILRRAGLRLRLRLVNAVIDAPSSTEYLSLCRAAAERAGIADAVEWHTAFLANDDSIALLGECDVVVLPHQASSEGASASARTALSAGMPVLTTRIALFDELGAAVLRTPGISPEAIAQGLLACLRDVEARIGAQTAARRLAQTTQWSRVAGRMHGMLISLAVQSTRRRDTASEVPSAPGEAAV